MRLRRFWCWLFVGHWWDKTDSSRMARTEQCKKELRRLDYWYSADALRALEVVPECRHEEIFKAGYNAALAAKGN